MEYNHLLKQVFFFFFFNLEMASKVISKSYCIKCKKIRTWKNPHQSLWWLLLWRFESLGVASFGALRVLFRIDSHQ